MIDAINRSKSDCSQMNKNLSEDFSKISFQMNILPEIFSEIRAIFSFKRAPSVSLIIPAYNEAPRIGKVLQQAKKVKEISEIIVIDDNSKDETKKIAENFGVNVVKHHRNMGKGEAIKTGITHAKGDIFLFLDADLMNITDKKIKALIRPILKNKADFVKASFGLARGRVTEFAIRPMMKVLYPDEKFKQPISGQFAGKRDFFKDIEIESEWGIDISILLDAIKKGERVIEVDLGELKHKARTPDEKAEMSKQVMETMMKKVGYICGEHKMIVFTDKTLFSPIFFKKVRQFLEILKSKKIKIVILTEKEIDKDFKKYFDKIKRIKSDDSPKKILQIIKRLAKGNDCELKNIVSVSNVKNFELVNEKSGLSYCFKRSPIKLRENSEIISSLAEILMYLK